MLPNLKKLRKEHNVSQAKLAVAINSSQQSINQYENQDIEPSIEMLKSIAGYFDCSIDYLVGKTDMETPHPVGLTDEDEKILKKYHRLNLNERACVNHVIDTLIESHE